MQKNQLVAAFLAMTWQMRECFARPYSIMEETAGCLIVSQGNYTTIAKSIF